MSDIEEKLEQFRVQLAKVRGSARFKLAETIPGVREGVEVVTLAEQLLVELVEEVRQARTRIQFLEGPGMAEFRQATRDMVQSQQSEVENGEG